MDRALLSVGSMNKLAVLIPLLSTLASAADPQLRERHAAVEASLSAEQRKVELSRGAVVVGATGLALSAVAAAIGVSVVATESAESLAYAAALPYATLVGAKPTEPRASEGSGEALLITGLVAGLASSVVLGIGAVALNSNTNSRQRKDLEREKIRIEYQLAVERRDALREVKRSLAEPSAPLLPQAAPPPMPAAAHLRGPLLPLADAPTR